MTDFTKSCQTGKKRALEALSWKNPGKFCVTLNAAQWMSNITEYWDNPAKRFEPQMQKLERNEKAGCGNFPIFLVNYGDSTIPTMFNAQVGQLEGGPWMEHLLNDIKEQKNLPKPTFDNPTGQNLLRTLDYFIERAPKSVAIVPPHKLSPFGNAAVIRGSEIYLDIYDNPKDLHELLKKITEATIYCYEFIHEKIGIPVQDGISPNGFPLPGIFFGDDSSINLNEEQIWEFNLKYLEILSKHFNSPLFCHYCVLNETQGLQLLKAYSDADFVSGLNNQYGPDFFIENYEKYFKNKLFLATETPQGKLGKNKEERLSFFKGKMSKMKDKMKDKSGLLYFLEVDQEELDAFVKTRDSFI